MQFQKHFGLSSCSVQLDSIVLRLYKLVQGIKQTLSDFLRKVFPNKVLDIQ